MGEYHCLRDAHILDLDYPAARAVSCERADGARKERRHGNKYLIHVLREAVRLESRLQPVAGIETG